jgi:hypothetical protein
VAGIVFDTLQARAQVPTSDLLVLREVLLEGASSAPSDLKVSICVTYAYAHSLHSICPSARLLSLCLITHSSPECSRATRRCGRCETSVCRLHSSLWTHPTPH